MASHHPIPALCCSTQASCYFWSTPAVSSPRARQAPSAVCMVGFPSFTPGVRFSGVPALPWFRVAVSLPAFHCQPGFLWFVSSPLCRHGSSPGRRRLPSRGLPYTPAGVSSAHTRGPVRNAFSSGSWGASPRGPRVALRHCLGLWRRGRQAQPLGTPWGVRAPEGCWSECVRGWWPGRGGDRLSQLRTRGICGASPLVHEVGEPLRG